VSLVQILKANDLGYIPAHEFAEASRLSDQSD